MSGIKAGTERPTFLEIWMVQVGDRVFARSWTRKENGWFGQLLEKGRGEVQFGEEIYPIRGKH
ncbi:MAG: DUF2255 family protein, partial [Bacteroidota bacterium]